MVGPAIMDRPRESTTTAGVPIARLRYEPPYRGLAGDRERMD